MNYILIMMSTYNGHKYIREQLDSLYAQENVNIHILVRDDGSKDDTVEILKEYQSAYGKMDIFAEENVGAAMSFYTLMRYAYDSFNEYDYYAFCDQDDVWMPDKLSCAVQMLQGKKEALYFCNVSVTDAALNIIGTLPIRETLSFPYVMFRQPALGCTQVLTSAYLKFCTEVFNMYERFNPPFIELHDVWTIWISQMVGVDVVIDNVPHMLYRQHGNNVTCHTSENIIQKMNRVIKRFKKYQGITYKNFQILNAVLHNRQTSDIVTLFRKMSDYQQSILKTLSFALYMQKYFSSLTLKAIVMYRILNRLF